MYNLYTCTCMDPHAPARARGGGRGREASCAATVNTLLQLVPLRVTTIGAETCRGSETKERVYEAAALP